MAVQQLGKGKGKVATEEPDWEQSREDCEERLRRQRIEWELQVQEQKDRNNQKIQWDRMKKEYRANKRRVKGHRWFSFFSVWFFMGLASIAVGVGIDAFWHPQEGTLAGAISHVLPGIFTTFGIALMMGAIFDFAKNSEHFIALVTDILTDVELTIKDHMVFDNRGAYHVTRQADGRRIEIPSSQWLNADTGFSVTISDTPLKKDLRVEEEMEPYMDGDTSETEDDFFLPPEQKREAIK